MEFGGEPAIARASSLLASYDRPNFSSIQLRTSSEPDSVMEFGGEPTSSCWFAASKLDDRPNFSSIQLRTSFEPASNQLQTR